MHYFSLAAALVCSLSCLHAQEINSGPRITAQGNAGVALQDIWCLQSNQAGIASIHKPIVAFACESNFFNSGIGTQSAVFAIPYHQNVFGLSLQNYGFSEYSEQKAGMAYARSFGGTVSASLDFNIHQIRIAQYGSAQTWSVEAGMQYRADDNLIIGTHISNPSRSAYDAGVNAVIPVIIELGASLKFTDNVLLNAAIVKELNSSGDFRSGIEYTPVNQFSFRGGIATNPFRQFAGFGCCYHSFKIDTALSLHPDLGYSPQLSVAYEF